jgi:dephospho-CoA kinase
MRLALTGGIGMGKSSAGEWLVSAGISVIDTDHVAQGLVSNGSPVLAEIRGVFGDGVLLPDGALNREEMARRVFTSEESRLKLESILHPQIVAAWEDFLSSASTSGHPIAVVIIPLLYEKGYEVGFDRVVAVGCSAATQLARLRQRGWDDDNIRARMAAQLPATEKMSRAQHVVWTEGSMEAHRDQWRRLLDRWAICSRA